MIYSFSAPKGLRILAVALSLIFFSSGCASSNYDQVKKVKPGMEKTEVLDILGNPNSTRRRGGRDIWTYVIFDDAKKQGADIFFTNGKVVKVSPAKLTISDEDELTDTGSLEEYEKAVEKQRQKRKKESQP